jgi:hypothetical protein
MPWRDIKLADKISLPEKNKNQQPNHSHPQLAEISGVPKSAIALVTQRQEKLQDEWTLRHGQQGTSRKRKSEDKDPDVEEVLNQLFSIVTLRVVRIVVQ